MDLLKDLGVEIKWTDSDNVSPFAAYFPRDHVLVLNRPIFKAGNARFDENVQELAICLFHEAGHAIWTLWGRIIGGNRIEYVEEVWCDFFAADMCRRLGLKWAANQRSPYLQELSSLIAYFV